MVSPNLSRAVQISTSNKAVISKVIFTRQHLALDIFHVLRVQPFTKQGPKSGFTELQWGWNSGSSASSSISSPGFSSADPFSIPIASLCAWVSVCTTLPNGHRRLEGWRMRIGSEITGDEILSFALPQCWFWVEFWSLLGSSGTSSCASGFRRAPSLHTICFACRGRRP